MSFFTFGYFVFYFWVFCVFAGWGLLFFSQIQFLFLGFGRGCCWSWWVWVFFSSDHRFFVLIMFFFSATIDFLFSAVFVFRGFGPATFVFFVDGEMHFCNGLLVCVQVDGCSILFHSMFLLTTVLFASVV